MTPTRHRWSRNSTGDYELSSLYAIGTGGAATNPKHVSALLEKLPQLTIINGYGSSETGNMGIRLGRQRVYGEQNRHRAAHLAT